MDKIKLINLCHKISNEKAIDYNTVQKYYFMERILDKISKSSYKDNFIFKGGFLLSNIIDISNRTTKDIDFSIKGVKLDKKSLLEILSEILNDDNINYEIISAEEIMDGNKYQGLRIKILCRLENIKEYIPLDVAIGDPITYSEINYKYKSLFSDTEINIQSYNLETILAKKIETLYSRALANSRIKDYYDIYVIYKFNAKDISYYKLLDACKNTFAYRGTKFDIDNIIDIINIIEKEEIFHKRWDNFISKNSCANCIKFTEILNNIKDLLNSIQKIK